MNNKNRDLQSFFLNIIFMFLISINSVQCGSVQCEQNREACVKCTFVTRGVNRPCKAYLTGP